MKKFKEKLTKELLMSYLLLTISDLLMALLYFLIYNFLLRELYADFERINLLQSYLIFYCIRLLFNRTQLKMNMEEEIFDSFKRNCFKFTHYLFWGIAIKLLFVFFT